MYMIVEVMTSDEMEMDIGRYELLIIYEAFIHTFYIFLAYFRLLRALSVICREFDQQ